jgi:Arylsulfotransferase (ASST)
MHPTSLMRRLAGPAAVLAGLIPAALAAEPAAAASPAGPPPVTVLTSGPDNGNGDIFISPFGDTASYQNGAEILSPSGKVIWFHPVPAGQEASDFRAQRYLGKPVLTWWQGTGLGGLSSGTDYIYNDHYQPIATVQAGNGYTADGHEFLITPWNTALILAYTTATANLTAIGGPADQEVIDGVVQEIDIRTGRVLFQWNSADHVPYSASEQPLPGSASTPWDWFHVNAVHLDSHGNLLIDARDTWATYDVSRRTGKILWTLGGKQSSFAVRAAPGQVLDQAGEIFAWQHDPEQVGPQTYTWFDNESSGTPLLAASRAVTVRLNFRTRTATLVASDDQPEGLVASSQGNVQTTGNGDLFVGWGILPYISEFSPSGRLVYNAELPAGVNTYRAYRLRWPAAAG